MLKGTTQEKSNNNFCVSLDWNKISLFSCVCACQLCDVIILNIGTEELGHLAQTHIRLHLWAIRSGSELFAILAMCFRTKPANNLKQFEFCYDYCIKCKSLKIWNIYCSWLSKTIREAIREKVPFRHEGWLEIYTRIFIHTV